MSRNLPIPNSFTTTEALSTLQNRYEYDSNDNPIYAGEAMKGTASSNEEWTILKYTWVAGTVSGYNMTLKQSAFGAWDNRSSLSYS